MHEENSLPNPALPAEPAPAGLVAAPASSSESAAGPRAAAAAAQRGRFSPRSMAEAVSAPQDEPSPLSDDQVEQLRQARLALGKIRRAVAYAYLDAVITAGLALLALLGSAVSFNVVGLVVGLGMAGIAVVEWIGAGRLARLDPKAARLLACNQFAFAGLITLYALVGLAKAWAMPAAGGGGGGGGGGADLLTGGGLETVTPEQMVDLAQSLARYVALAVYALLIPLTWAVQGGAGWFYWSRGKHLRRFCTQTPAWIAKLYQQGVLG